MNSMVGLKLFTSCLREIFVNWRVAIGLSWFWLLVGQAQSYLASYLHGLNFDTNGSVDLRYVELRLILDSIATQIGLNQTFSMELPLDYFVLFLIVSIASAAGIMIIAIGWFRITLRHELPHKFYVVRWEWPLGKYIWTTLKYGIIIGLIHHFIMYKLLFVVMLSMMTPEVSDFISGFGIPSSLVTRWGVLTVFLTFLSWIALRIGLILPSAAINGDMTIRKSISLTRPISGQLIITAFCLAVLASFSAEIFGLVFLQPEWVKYPAIFIVVWVTFFVKFGILSMVYRHVVAESLIED